MPNRDNDWDDAEIVKLRGEWDEGLSTAEIGRRHNRSKNSIVGKAHRLHRDNPLAFIPRASPIIRDPSQPPRAYRPPRAPKATLRPLQSVEVPLAPPLRLAPPPKPKPPPQRYRGTCQWPTGEPGTKGFRFCDKPAIAGVPYCNACAEKAYPAWKERRRMAHAAA